MLDRSRTSEALTLLDQRGHELQGAEEKYLYQKISLKFIWETEFESAGKVLLKADWDPRTICRMWPDLVGKGVSEDEEIEVFEGLVGILGMIRSIDDLGE
jgi:hypothetical protein